jgi:hypothetical protein
MKKISTLVLALIFANGIFSQDGETKNFRFGLKIAPSVNWLKPDDTRKFENGGSTLGFNWGLITEFALSDLFSVSTGLELNHEKGKINYVKNNYYYMNEDLEFIETEEIGSTGLYGPSDTTKAYDALKLTKRSYHNTYVTLPIAIKMKTKEIGYMTYFGEFGLNLSFLTGTKVTDEASPTFNVNSNAFNDLEKINFNDMFPVRTQLQVGFGTEYKMAGETALVAALHYNLGFTNIAKKNSKYLVNDASEQVSQSFSAHGVRLTIGILF